jgi:signal transduction histidine kinase
MATLGSLVSGVAHELNNPLNFIQGGHVGLKRYFESWGSNDSGDTDFFLSSIETGISRAKTILAGLNMFSRSNENLDEVCDIHAILDNCSLLLNVSRASGIILKKNYAVQEIITRGNAGMLHQVFSNVLSNSLASIEHNEGEIDIDTRIHKGKAEIRISDNGVGMDEETLRRVTDPFFTTRPPGLGTGLGLSISSSIIQRHAGTIEFISKKGTGTTAIVTLPLSD